MRNLKRVEGTALFLTVFLLPTQLGRHFWPIFSFIYSLPIDYLSPTIYFWDLLIVILWLIFLLRRKKINRKALNLFFLFLLTQILSLLSPMANLGAGFTRLEQYIIAGLFGVYLASLDFSKVKAIIFWGTAGAIFLESFLAIGQFLKGGTLGFWILGERSFSLSTPAIAKFDFKGTQFLRPYATFPHPNVLAAFMVIMIILLSGIKEFKEKKYAIFLAGLTTLLTVSRASIFAGVFASAFLLKKKGRFFILLGCLLLLPVFYPRFSSVLNFDNLTLVRREQLSRIALKAWFKSPIFGIGLNNFIPFAQDLLLSGPSRFLQPVHNIFLLALSETGLVGFLGWLGLLGYPIWLNRKRLRILLIWAVIVFLGMFDHYFLTLAQGYRLLFLIWGLSFSMLE